MQICLFSCPVTHRYGFHFLIPFLLLIGFILPANKVYGEDTQKEGTPANIFDEFISSITEGKFNLNLRLRAEVVEQNGLDTAQAYTERLRLGYSTKPFYGLSLFAELEDVHALGPDLYNAAGLNGEGNKAVIADPEDTELNQFYLKYVKNFESLSIESILGRQRLILNDARFVGNVGWRQNEQTFDAYTLKLSAFEDFSFLYSYVDEINRIFGPSSGRDFDSDSHLIDFAYSGLSYLKVTTFAYILDLSANALSSNTVGARINGTADLSETLLFNYTASYAYQTDGEGNTTDYKADYYQLEAGIGKKGLISGGLGYEVLGSDSGQAAFTTPLATLHKFNGWADVFLATPTNGLEDLYIFTSIDLPWTIKSKWIYHFFYSDEGSADLGEEFDAVLSKKLTKNIAVLAKMAVFFNGNSNYNLANRQKYWIQMEINF